MAALEAARAVLTRWAEEAKVLVKECEASRVAGLVNSLRVLSLTLCAESGACADEKEMEEEKMEEVEKEEKVCLEESNSALRTALEKAERVTHELEDRVTGLEAAARRSQGAWEAKEKEAKRLALEVESVRRLNDELKMENEGLKRCVGEVSENEGVNGVSEEKEETEKESVNEEENEKEVETEKEGVNEEENAMTEEKEMEEEKASEVEKEEMKVEEEEEEKEALVKEEKMEEEVVDKKAEEEKAKEATEEKESTVEGENMVNEEKENKKEMEEEQKEKEEPAMKGENTVNEEKEEKEKEMEEQNEKEQKEKENKETTNEQATTPETDNHPPTAEAEKLSQKRAAEENPNPPSKKPYTLTLSTLKLRIRYAFEKWNPKWMRRMKAVSDKLDKMAKTPEEGFKEMCTMYCIGRGVMGSYKWDEEKIQEMEKIQSQSDYDAMVQEWKKDWVCLLRKRDHTAESGRRFKQAKQ